MLQIKTDHHQITKLVSRIEAISSITLNKKMKNLIKWYKLHHQKMKKLKRRTKRKEHLLLPMLAAENEVKLRPEAIRKRRSTTFN